MRGGGDKQKLERHICGKEKPKSERESWSFPWIKDYEDKEKL